MFPLNRLMPTTVGGKTKDLCIRAFNKQVGGEMTRKAFVVGVAALRAAEKSAVTLTDAMQRAPIESIIFNSYKSLVKTSDGDQKKFLKNGE